jgi:hypothetical protein
METGTGTIAVENVIGIRSLIGLEKGTTTEIESQSGMGTAAETGTGSMIAMLTDLRSQTEAAAGTSSQTGAVLSSSRTEARDGTMTGGVPTGIGMTGSSSSHHSMKTGAGRLHPASSSTTTITPSTHCLS